MGAAIRQSQDRSPVCRLYDVQRWHTKLRWLWARRQRQQHGVPLRLDGILNIGWSIGSKDRAEVAKLGDLPADNKPHVLCHSFASFAADPGLRADNRNLTKQIRSFRRCRGQCHHEADPENSDLGFKRNPSCGITREMHQSCGTESPPYRCSRDTWILQVSDICDHICLQPCGTEIEYVNALWASTTAALSLTPRLHPVPRGFRCTVNCVIRGLPNRLPDGRERIRPSPSSPRAG